jgi:hypothetical protein
MCDLVPAHLVIISCPGFGPLKPGCDRDLGCNSWLHQTRKEITHCSCPVVHQTVWCAHGQKARIAYQIELQRLLAALGYKRDP